MMEETQAIRCPGCGRRLKVPNDKRGTVVRCPQCREPFTIPAPGSNHSPKQPAPAGVSPVPVERPLSANPASGPTARRTPLFIGVGVLLIAGVGVFLFNAWQSPDQDQRIAVTSTDPSTTELRSSEADPFAKALTPPQTEVPEQPPQDNLPEMPEPMPQADGPVVIPPQDAETRRQIAQARQTFVEQRSHDAESNVERFRELDAIILIAGRDHSRKQIDRSLLRLVHALELLATLRRPVPDPAWQARDREVRNQLALRLQELQPIEYLTDTDCIGAHLSPDGRYLMYSDNEGGVQGRIVIWDIDQSEVANTLSLGATGQVTFFPSGDRQRTVIVQRQSAPLKRVALWDWSRFEEIPLPIRDLPVPFPTSWHSHNTYVDAHGEQVLVVGEQGFGLWHLEQGRFTAQVPQQARYMSHTFSPDGRRLLVELAGRRSAGLVQMLEMPTLKQIGQPFPNHSLSFYNALLPAAGLIDHRTFSADGSVARIYDVAQKQLIDAVAGVPRASPKNDPDFQGILDAVTFGNRFSSGHGISDEQGNRKLHAVRRRAKQTVPEPVTIDDVPHPFQICPTGIEHPTLVISGRQAVLLDRALAVVGELSPDRLNASIVDATCMADQTTAALLLDDGTVGLWDISRDQWSAIATHEDVKPLALFDVASGSRLLSVGRTDDEQIELRIWDRVEQRQVAKPLRFKPFEDVAGHLERPVETAAIRAGQKTALAEIFATIPESPTLLVDTADGLWSVDLTTGELGKQPIPHRDIVADATPLRRSTIVEEPSPPGNPYVLQEVSWSKHARCRFVVAPDGTLSAQLRPQALSGDAAAIRLWLESMTASTLQPDQAANEQSAAFRNFNIAEWKQSRGKVRELGVMFAIPEIDWGF